MCFTYSQVCLSIKYPELLALVLLKALNFDIEIISHSIINLDKLNLTNIGMVEILKGQHSG